MAAGKGTRMKSRTPKVLQRLGGRALVAHVIDTATDLQARQVVVITGHGAPEVEAFISRQYSGKAKKSSDSASDSDSHAGPAQALQSVSFARQEPQLGTGHAVQQAIPVLADDGITLVLSGDVPLTQGDTLKAPAGAVW
jgi:bifunctional UDP-N-acetylglucosamine pyrophosphorylase / glucosamine-1-phosphate N-acetyltransferase